jgi:hypothetical protein
LVPLTLKSRHTIRGTLNPRRTTTVTDPLEALAADPVLFGAIVTHIAELPDTPRERAHLAVHEQRISVAFLINDEYQQLAIDCGWIDDTGTHRIALLDARPFGYHLIEGEILHAELDD